MHNFKRGTVLKLTCDVHEFLAKAPKAYEDLIDIIDEDGTVKVKTNNGDYVGFYGIKAKIHTRFMKQFVDVTPDKIGVPVIELDKQDVDGINEQVASLSTPNDELSTDSIMNDVVNVDDWLYMGYVAGESNKADKGYESTSALVDKAIAEMNKECFEIRTGLLADVTDSLAMAASKLNSLGYEFKGIYIKGMPVAELAKAAGSSYPAAKDWVGSRVSRPRDGAAHMVLHCKWGCNDNHKVKNQ